MQKLFSQEVRFKADDGSDFPDWEEKTLGDICVYERQRSEGANFVGTENMLKDFGGVTFDNSNADGSGTLYHLRHIDVKYSSVPQEGLAGRPQRNL